MKLKKDAYYSIKETTQFVPISERLLQMYAKKNNFIKIDGRYVFTGHQIQELNEKRSEKQTKKIVSAKSLAKDNLKHQERIKELIIEVQNLTEKLQEKDRLIEEVKSENEELKNNLKKHPNLTHREQLEKAIELITIEAVKKGLNHRVFTDSEYEEMIGTISQVSFQEEQIQYLRNRVEKQDQILQRISNNLTSSLEAQRERNYIEAKEKKFDT